MHQCSTDKCTQAPLMAWHSCECHNRWGDVGQPLYPIMHHGIFARCYCALVDSYLSSSGECVTLGALSHAIYDCTCKWYRKNMCAPIVLTCASQQPCRLFTRARAADLIVWWCHYDKELNDLTAQLPVLSCNDSLEADHCRGVERAVSCLW